MGAGHSAAPGAANGVTAAVTLRIAWFATAKGTSSRLLFQRALEAIAKGRLSAEIVVAFCNRERGQAANTDAFLDTVEAAGVPLVTLSSAAWRQRADGESSDPGQSLPPWRRDFDTAVYERLAPYRPDVGVLAGYMLIATETLCDRLALLNLHPAAPGGPVGTWQQVICQLIDQQAGNSGLMLQRAITDLDHGPILSFCTYPLQDAELAPLWAARAGPAREEEPLFQAIRRRGVQREPHFVVASLGAIADGRIAIPSPHDAGPAVDLTAEIEAALATEPA